VAAAAFISKKKLAGNNDDGVQAASALAQRRASYDGRLAMELSGSSSVHDSSVPFPSVVS
jgi:hypothetical protein